MCDIDLKVIILYLTVAARDAEWMECLDKCQKKGHSRSKCYNKRCKYPTVLDQQINAVIHTIICDNPKIYSGRFWEKNPFLAFNFGNLEFVGRNIFIIERETQSRKVREVVKMDILQSGWPPSPLTVSFSRFICCEQNYRWFDSKTLFWVL